MQGINMGGRWDLMVGCMRGSLCYLSNILQPKCSKMRCIIKVNYLYYNFNFYVGLELISNERVKIGDLS